MTDPSPDHSLLVNESLRQRFEASWTVGTPEPLSECLPGTDTDEFGPTLEELIHIQLEFAWKAHSADGERPVSVQALLEEYPVLGDDAVLLRLLRQEYHCRETAGDSPSADDYRRAFPDRDLEHLTTPPGETIGPKASDDTATDVATADQATLPPPGTAPPAPLADQMTLDAPVAATNPADEQTLAPPAGDEKPSSIQDDATLGGGTPGVAIDVDNSSDTFNTGTSEVSVPVDPGKQVPGYELLGELGRGGMGVVYRALDSRLKRVVALKMILSGVHADEEDLKRFQREAEAVAQLQHPNIVQIHDVGEHDGQPFFSLEFVEGGGLDEKIGGEPQPPREAAALVEQLARAVHFAHERNIVHRDLKPANVLLTAQGEPKITDFGLAKRLEDDASQTASGSIMGTPSYMAPEQAGDKQATIGPQTDVYALGAILYCLLTGRPPFQSSSVMDTVMQVLEQEPMPPSQLVSGLDRNLETITLKCLQKAPVKRYQSAEDVAEELRRYQAGEPIQARPIGRMERAWRWCRRKPAMAGACGLAAILLLVLSIGGPLVALQQARMRQVAQKLREAEAEQRDKAEKARKDAEFTLQVARRQLYISDMVLAQRHWEDANIVQLNVLLHRHRNQSRLRGLEWDYWKRHVNSHLRAFNHSGKVYSVDFSSDGKRIASGSLDRTVKVTYVRPEYVRPERGQVDLILKGHTNTVASVMFSPDGKRIVSGSVDKTLKVWDAETGKETHTLKGHSDTVASVAFSPDGNRIVSGSYDKTVKLWDAETGEELLTLPGHSSTVSSVDFSPDGERIVSGSRDRTFRVWDATTGRATLSVFAGSLVNCVDFSPGGNRIASGASDGTISVWDAKTGKVMVTLKGHTDVVKSVNFSPDGKQIVSGSQDTLAKVWDAETGQELLTFPGHSMTIWSVSFSPDGKRFVSGSGDKTLKLWDAEMGQDPLTFTGYSGGGLSGVSFNSDARRIIGSGEGNTAKIWNAATGEERHTLTGHSKEVCSVSFSPDRKRCVSGSADKTLKVWDAETGEELLTLPGHSSGVWSVDFGPDGNRIVSGSADKTVKVWDAKTGEELLTLEGHSAAVSSVAFSPDGKRIASGSWDKTAKVWDAVTGSELRTYKRHSRAVMCVGFSPDGKQIISGSLDKTLMVWDVSKEYVRLILKGHNDGVGSVSFSPSGKRIVSGSRDKTVRVWDTETGKVVLILKGHTNIVTSVSFSADGRRIVSGSGDKTLKVWDSRRWTGGLRVQQKAARLLKSWHERMLTKLAAQRELRDDRTLSEDLEVIALQRVALKLVDGYESPSATELNLASWAIVRLPDGPKGRFREALGWAERACRLKPATGYMINTLGVAQYRTGQYEESLKTLSHALELGAKDKRPGGSGPGDLAFQAMAHFRLEHKNEAMEHLGRLREIMKQGRWLNDLEARALLEEAEALIEGARARPVSPDDRESEQPAGY